MKVVYSLIAALAFAPAAHAVETSRGRCMLFGGPEYKKLTEKAFALTNANEREVIYEAGPVKYEVVKSILEDQHLGTLEFLHLEIRDSSRNLELSTAQPLEQGRALNLQITPPYGLPQAFCVDARTEKQ